ncbi:hypothetical protein A4X06_0g7553 [Tilletia controversa]|uniref:Uncharacterized protein n=1 Tax=Tilletia controversa TaxID=13291 RepID=A0A8X7SU11_9BASI|nr:hypothetical protein CF328_g8042 [Tilletia controversa]KAE8241399.1 hypothetical protein A4X06_0g7553 [Tilletia controversa]
MALAAKTPARPSGTTGSIVDALETFMQRKCDSFQETLFTALQKYLNVKITQSALQKYLNVKIPQLAEADDENDAPENGTSSSDNRAAEADGANESPPEVVASFKPGLELACSKAQDEMALVAKAAREMALVAKATRIALQQEIIWYQNRLDHRKPAYSAPNFVTQPESSTEFELAPHQADDGDEQMESDNGDVSRQLRTAVQEGQTRLEVDISSKAAEGGDHDASNSGTLPSDNRAAEADGVNKSPLDVVALFKRAAECVCHLTQDEMDILVRSTGVTPQVSKGWIQACRYHHNQSGTASTSATQLESSKGRELASRRADDGDEDMEFECRVPISLSKLASANHHQKGKGARNQGPQ